MPQIDNPSKEDVAQLHERFCIELEALFEKHKSKYVENYENVKLIME